MNLPTGSEAPRPLGVGQANPAPGRDEALAALCQQAADLGLGAAEMLEHLARTQPNGGRLARNVRPALRPGPG